MSAASWPRALARTPLQSEGSPSHPSRVVGAYIVESCKLRTRQLRGRAGREQGAPLRPALDARRERRASACQAAAAASGRPGRMRSVQGHVGADGLEGGLELAAGGPRHLAGQREADLGVVQLLRRRALALQAGAERAPAGTCSAAHPTRKKQAAKFAAPQAGRPRSASASPGVVRRFKQRGVAQQATAAQHPPAPR